VTSSDRRRRTKPISPEHVALAVALREAREQRPDKLTQEALAERAGLARTAINELERARRNPSFSTLLALSRALDRPLPALFVRYQELLNDPETDRLFAASPGP
jgi:transcriptional regulator with XRE-family HTH domain